MSAIQVYWDGPEKTIIRLDIHAKHDLDDVRRAVDEAAEMILQVPHNVDAVWYWKVQTPIPRGNVIGLMRHMITIHPINLKRTVYAGQPKPMQRIHQSLGEWGLQFNRGIMQKHIDHQSLYADTLEAAYDLLRTHSSGSSA